MIWHRFGAPILLFATAVAFAAPAVAANGLDRDEEPVVLTGSDLPSLAGSAIGTIVAFRWDGAWLQIPVQVDERAVVDFGEVYGLEPTGQTLLTYTDEGTFTGADPDPSFDGDDELVLLARDAGAPAPAVPYPAGTVAGSRTDVRLAHPTAGASAWVHLYRSDGSLDPSAGAAPITYEFVLLSGDYRTTYDTGSGPNPEDSSVDTGVYAVHFSDRWIRDGLRVHAGGATAVDLLDRHRFEFRPGDCSRTEDTFSNGEGAFLVNRTGPVRAIRGYVGANSGPTTYRVHLFYRAREDVRSVLRVHGIPGVLDYLDLEPGATGMAYLSDAIPAGVTVDGAPDAVPTGRVAWEAVTGEHGTVAQVHEIDTDIPDLEIASFYRDEAEPSQPPCTGDGSYFGAHGLRVPGRIPNTDPEVPGDLYRFEAVRHHLYGPPDAGAALGTHLAEMIAAPLVVTVEASPTCPDRDGDGWLDGTCDPDPGPSGGDCDDGDPQVYPGGPELCDARDGDCDGTIDNPACDDYDRNGDRRVDGRELAWVGRAFGSCSLDPPSEWWYEVDFDRDGCVDGDDLATLANVWARSCEGGVLLCD